MTNRHTASSIAAAGLAVAMLASGCSSSDPTPASAKSSPSASDQPSSGSSAEAKRSAKPKTSGSTASGDSGASPTPGPVSTAKPDNQTTVLESLSGSSSPRCAPVGKRTDVRSGRIAIGNFATARKQYKKEAPSKEQPEVFLYVIPEHSKKMRNLTLTVKPITGEGKSRTIKSNSVEQAEMWNYYAVNLPISAPGSYRLTAVSGADKGCFEVRFSR